jgi:hypothetical protein
MYAPARHDNGYRGRMFRKFRYWFVAKGVFRFRKSPSEMALREDGRT